MSAPVFVDTNVLVYARDAGEPTKQPLALAWLEHLWRTETGRTSVQVLSEFYVTVTRKLAPGLPAEDAWDDVQSLLTWRPQPIDSELLTRARQLEQQNRLSWWDSLIVAAAQALGCVLLLSEDLQDGTTFGEVVVRSPFKIAAGEVPETYIPSRSSRAAPRRGRPRRR